MSLSDVKELQSINEILDLCCGMGYYEQVIFYAEPACCEPRLPKLYTRPLARKCALAHVVKPFL